MAYFTALLIISIIAYPITFVVAFVAKMLGIKKIYRDMFCDEAESAENISTIDKLIQKEKKARRERRENIIIGLIGFGISAAIAIIWVCNN